MPAYKWVTDTTQPSTIARDAKLLNGPFCAIKDKIGKLTEELKKEDPESFFSAFKEKSDKKNGLQYILDHATVANFSSIEADTLKRFPKMYSGFFSETPELVKDYLSVLEAQYKTLRVKEPISEGNRHIKNNDL